MIPIEKIASGTITNLIVYLSIIGILLFVATLLRLKFRFLRKAFIPASLIAGIIGLILGPYVLGVFSPEVRSSFAAIPTPFTVIVFACMQLGVKRPKVKESLQLAAPSVFQAYSYSFSQFGLTCLLTALIFTPFWRTDALFGSVIEIGFMGGHGTAGGMTDVYAGLGWAAGADVGQTTATIGLIVGIFGGLWMVNMAAKRRYRDAGALLGGLHPGHLCSRDHGSTAGGSKHHEQRPLRCFLALSGCFPVWVKKWVKNREQKLTSIKSDEKQK